MISLLFVFIFISAIFAGSLGLASFQELVQSKSLQNLRGDLRTSSLLFYAVVILGLILAFNISHIYIWADTIQLSWFRSQYLSPQGFYIRNAIYALTFLFLVWSFRREKLRPPALVLILLGLIDTFFATDWLQSLDVNFHSTAFGLIFFISSALLAFAFHLYQKASFLNDDSLIKLNSIHLAMIGAWSYLVFIQFLVVWSENIPEESSWYISRMQTSWKLIPILLALFQFALPVFLLFFRTLKRSIPFTKGLCVCTVTMQSLHLVWLIFPSIYPAGFQISLFSYLAFMLAGTSPLWVQRLRLYEST